MKKQRREELVEEVQELEIQPDGLEKKTVRRRRTKKGPQKWAFELLLKLTPKKTEPEQFSGGFFELKEEFGEWAPVTKPAKKKRKKDG